MIYDENHNKCYFKDTSKLWSSLLATFPFGTKLILYRDRYPHIPHDRLLNTNPEQFHVFNTGSRGSGRGLSLFSSGPENNQGIIDVHNTFSMSTLDKVTKG